MQHLLFLIQNYSEPYFEDIEYGRQISPTLFSSLKEKNVRKIVLVSTEDLKHATPFVFNPKLHRTNVLANTVFVGGKSIAEKDNVVTREMLIDFVKKDIETVEIYKTTSIPLTKFRRTNQDTVVNKYPLVTQADVLTEKTPIINGEACDRGRLALGQNLLTAYAPWRGSNYQDAIVLSQRLVEGWIRLLQFILKSIKYRFGTRKSDHKKLLEIFQMFLKTSFAI